MRFTKSIGQCALLGAVLLGVASCSDAMAPAATREAIAPLSTVPVVSFSPALLAAVVDADLRLTPALDADTRAPMHVALGELHAALSSGQAARTERAVLVLRALVAGHQGEHASRNIIGTGDALRSIGVDGADLSALALLADAVDAEIRPR